MANKLDIQEVSGAFKMEASDEQVKTISAKCVELQEKEKEIVKEFIKSYLKDENSDKILKNAEEIEKNSNQLLSYTNIIKQNSLEIKKDIIEHLWKVLISDNAVDQYESNLMRRICGLIYFSDKECAEIKLNLINSK